MAKIASEHGKIISLLFEITKYKESYQNATS
jgi:hypothetical protein